MVAEIFLAASLQVLFERLMSPDLLQFARREGIDSTLKKWERTLKIIDSVLSDAEEKQLTDKGVKMWLDDLRDLAYDVEDILDEFATEAKRRNLMKTHAHQGASTSKVRGFFTSNWNPVRAIKFDVSMGSKIKKITSRLEELCKQRDNFGLKDVAGKASSSSTAAPSAAVYPRPPTTCLPTEVAVYGREEDKAKVLAMVLEDDPNDTNFGVVSIVGMGGLGKTTLAREVYHNEAVKDFQPKAWVCVSDDFDVLRISKAILESITSKTCDLKDLNQVQLQLKDALAGKKFLLVLDDVWSKDYMLWVTLRAPFMEGAPGSKVIVTTRSSEVASKMGPIDCYNLKLLLDEDCWSIFKKHAFHDRDINAYSNLGLIRDKVVEKCKGLPLAASTLGGLLRSKSYDEWEDILNSRIWDASDETEILPVLKLSYHHLPSHLKRCFAYCAMLPKDYEFNKEDLVLLWMAEDLIQKPKNNKQLEDEGSEYFNELFSRSLFQHSVSNDSTYVMHDLLSDLAQWISGETSFRLEERDEENKQPNMYGRARHFSFVSTDYEGKGRFEVLRKTDHLRTLLAISKFQRYCETDEDGYSLSFIPLMVVSDMLLKLKKLRALSLENYYIIELPDIIGDLIHLRYLNLSHTMIKSLPKSVSSLFNLQTLKLSYCYRLLRLPSIENMSNLYHLDIRGTKLLKEMPLGIKELKNLQTLSNFIVGKERSSCALKDLKTLMYLHGKLCISRLENAVAAQNTREAILSDKKGLRMLELEWASDFGDSCNAVEEENVLEMLQPHTNLRSLILKGYGGTRFPYWLGDASFSNMTILRLERCENCTSLPSIGLLSSLKDLAIVGMKRLRKVASEFYGEGCLKPFQSLKILRFEDLQEWDCWEKIEDVESFPCLCDLSIKKCHKLSGELPDHLPLLEKLVISECAQLVVSLSSLPVLCQLEVKGCQRVVWSSSSDHCQSLNSMSLSGISEFGNRSMQGFQKAESLKIDGCEELIHMWQNEMSSLEKTPKRLHAFNSMRKLCILNCTNLVQFPEICFLLLLTELTIVDCYALKSLPEGMKQSNLHLERLNIDGNHSLPFLTRGQLPSSLKVLELIRCEKLQYVFADADQTCSSSSSSSDPVIHEEDINYINTSLESLFVESCPSLTCLSTRDPLPSTLKSLLIDSCSKIVTLWRGQLPNSLKQLLIGYCPKVESITERFHSSMLLETIIIRECESLESIPEGIDKLSRLRAIGISSCPNLVCFPEGGLPNNNFREFDIDDCENLKALPRGMQTLNSLQVWECPSIESISEECFTTKLTTLAIGNLYMYQRLSQWGLHKLTSLTDLGFCNLDEVVSFEIGRTLPTSLTHLTIGQFPKLKYLSSDGFQNLTSLVYLSIDDCPNLVSFPKIGLPSSLLQLYIRGCPMLQKRCRRDKGQEWSKIAHIPCIEIDFKPIDELLEEE